MTTCAEVLLEVARKLDSTLRDGTTTGSGTTTTVIDANNNEPDDAWNGGALWILSGANIGQVRQITDWALSTHTFTMAAIDAFPNATPAGVYYAAASGRYTPGALKAAVNAALLECGSVEARDVSLTGLAATYEYTLPSGVANLSRVETVSSSGQVTRNQYWREHGGLIIFDYGRAPAAGDVIRLYYVGPHAMLSADTDVVSASVHVPKLVWGAVYHALFARAQDPTALTPDMQKEMEHAKRMYDEMRMRYPNRTPARDAHLGGF